MDTSIEDLTGLRFGRLLVEKFAYIKRRCYCWICRCDCGNKKVVYGYSLKSGNTKSCGCLHKERLKKYNKDRVFSEETCKKMSKNHADFSGFHHPRYNPYITNEERDNRNINKRIYPKYYEWRKSIFDRDNYTCQKCGKIRTKLQAHHIESYATNKNLRININNGITFCKRCHKEFHHQYGYKNNTTQLREFINNNEV